MLLDADEQTKYIFGQAMSGGYVSEVIARPIVCWTPETENKDL